MKLRIANFKLRMPPRAGGGMNSEFNLRNSRSARAFTLVEIMMAMMIFSLVVAAIYSTLMLVMRATRVGQDAAVQAQRQRIVLRTIEDSLMCIQSFQASQKYYWFGVENGPAPMLSFASRVPTEGFPRNGKFGDFNLRRLTFTLEAAPEGGTNLVLRQNPVLMDLDEDEKKFPVILAHNVKAFMIECWDKNRLEWTDKWITTNAIPPMVRVGLVLGANVSGGAPDFAVVRSFAMPSAMMPPAVQGVGGAGGPGAGLPGMNPAPPPGGASLKPQ